LKKSPNTSTVHRMLRVGWPGIVAVLVITLLYREEFAFYWQDWNRKDGYYSHGMLVPLIVIYMVWANRKRLAAHAVTRAWYGTPLILAAVPIYVFGKWTDSGMLLDTSLMLVIIGSVWSFAGSKITRILLFPLLYLMFMMPLPGTVLDESTMRIQMQSTRVASAILNTTGYASTMVGANEIHSVNLPEPLVVGVACSGFKLLIALMTFTAFFVYMIQAPTWKRALLIVFAVPLSVFINSLRIAMIGYAGIWTGTAEAMHEFHDWSGYLGLAICFLVLFGFAKLIKANKFGIREDVETTSSTAAETTPARKSASAISVAALLLMLAFGLTITPLKATAKGVLPRTEITKGFGCWSSEDVVVADNVVQALKTADVLQRVFVNGNDGRRIELFMEAARDTNAFHNPMMCIPGSGSGISNTEVIPIEITKPRPVHIHATLIKVSDLNGQDGYIIHWYMIGSDTFPTTSDIRRHMRVLQLQDMYRTITHFSRRAELRNEMRGRQAYWYRFYTDAFGSEQDDVAALKSFIVGLIEHNQSFGEQ